MGVLGYSVDKVSRIKANSVTNAFISSDGSLILETEGGAQFNAGMITDPSPVIPDQAIVTLGAFDRPSEDVVVPLWPVDPNSDRFKTSDPSPLLSGTTGLGLCIDWSSDGRYLAIGLEGSSKLLLFKRFGNTFKSLTAPATLPAGTNVYGVAFSPNGLYLAVASSTDTTTGGYVTIYKRSGDVFTKLPDPAVVPTGVGVVDVSWSPDGQYLSFSTPPSAAGFITYKVSFTTDLFTKLDDLSGYFSDDPIFMRWSPDGIHAVLGQDPSTSSFFIFQHFGDDISRVSPEVDTKFDAVPIDCVWSPNGKYLIFIHEPDSSGNTLSIYVRGTDYLYELLSSYSFGDMYPSSIAISPDGAYLGCGFDSTESSSSEETFLLLTMDWENGTFASDSNDEQSDVPGDVITSLAWSPDGLHLAYLCGTSSPSLVIYHSGQGERKNPVIPVVIEM